MKIEKNVSLAKFTTLRVGGPADFFACVKNEKDIQLALAFACQKKMPFFLLGGGSNVLFPDVGFRGLIIKNEISDLKFTETGVTVGSGAVLGQLITKMIEQKLSGLENLAGLPGAVGGAVAGNAGSYGTEIGDLVESAVLVEPSGRIKTVDRKYFHFRYRSSRLKRSDEILICVTLNLQPAEKNLKKTILEIIRQRTAKQPRGATAGSWFRNPTGKKAWQLIDGADLREARVGDAAVSREHANYLINLGQATANDFLRLSRRIQQAVREQYGIRLVREVVVVKNLPQA